MSEPTVEILNPYCFYGIFKALRTKCETENRPNEELMQYADLINFAASSSWTREQFYHWDSALYDKLDIRLFENNSERIIDLGQIYIYLKGTTKHNIYSYFKSLLNGIKENENLSRVTLKYTYEENLIENYSRFKSIISLLQKERQIIYLNIELTEVYILSDLKGFRNLEELHLTANITAEELSDCCEWNPNLRILSIMGNIMNGNWKYITFGGNKLQKLEQLDLLMHEDIDPKDYRDIGNLPQLNHLRLRGQYEVGSLGDLFDSLGKTNSLDTLIIDGAKMNAEETLAISQIKSLRQLKCGFLETCNIGHLTQLDKLEINTKHKSQDLLLEIMKILMQMEHCFISITFREGRIDFEKMPKRLRLSFNPRDIDLSEYNDFVEGLDLFLLHIIALSHKRDSLSELFTRFASRMPQTLQHLRLTGKSLDDIHPKVMPIPEQLVEDTYFRIDRQEILEISKIKSLRSLSCVFDNLYNIFVLDQLPHLEILTIKVSTFLEKAEIEALKMLFIGLATKPEQTLKRLDISGLTIDLPLSNEMAKIQSLQKLGCKFLNSESIEPLSKLYQLHTLEIKSTHDFNSFSQAILQILTLTNSGSFKIEFELLYSSIFYRNDLKKIELQLDPETDATTFAALGDWEIYLNLSIVKECKAGSLLSLFEILSKRKNHKLTHLYIEDMPINYKETLLISEIKSLQEIGCSFSDPRSIKHLHRLTALELIILKDRELAIDIVSFLNSFQQQEIMIEHGNRKIVYNKSRGSLILKNNSLDGEVHDYSDYACLGKLDHLKTLRIAGKNNRFSLQKLLKNIALRANLSELIIEKEVSNEFTTVELNVVENIQAATPAITPDEVMEIVKIRPLKTLKCGFSKSQNIEFLAELKELKNLTITTHQAGSLQCLFEKIAMQTSTALEFLSIEENALTLNELRPLAGIKTLKRLEVNSISTENQDGLPTFVHLKELFIRSHHGETLFIEPEPSFDSVLESIIIMGDSLGVQDVIALAQYKSLRKLQVNLQQFMRIDLLSSLCKLEDLNIQLLGSETHFSGSMIPKYPSNLRKFNLQSVDCIVDEAAIEPLALLDQLETLSITLPKNRSLVALLQALAQKSILKHLIINRKLLDSDEVLNLKEITSLTSVQCGFLNDAFFYDLQNLINLKSVTATSHHDFINISEPLLNFLKYCKRIDSIDLPNCKGEFDENFLMKAKSILEKIRCPITQKPLELRMGSSTNFDQ